MKHILIISFLVVFFPQTMICQTIPNISKVDYMLLQGQYEKVIDTCNLLLQVDSLNPELYYKVGIAYQNTLDEDLSLNSFNKALSLDLNNKIYNFSLAKGYYNKKKYELAEPLFNKLYSEDSISWRYGYYLTSIYMQSNKFDKALRIYDFFLKHDSTNYIYLDKAAFAHLRKGNYEIALNLYNKSLSLNSRDITAIKNIAHIYNLSMESDTAIQLISKGIEIDSSDMDLYARRAQLYYSRNYTKRAMDDYLVILSSGDTTSTHLKRIGIGYCNNLQPKEAIDYLLLAYKKDSSDYETCSYLGQSYNKIKDFRKSIYYYNRVINILSPVDLQLGYSYRLLADAQSEYGNYKEAAESFLKSYKINPNPGIYMLIANIYDEKLSDREKAIEYYQKFIASFGNSKSNYPESYLENIKKRLDYLKNNPQKK